MKTTGLEKPFILFGLAVLKVVWFSAFFPYIFAPQNLKCIDKGN